jgi:hypothetical protein
MIAMIPIIRARISFSFHPRKDFAIENRPYQKELRPYKIFFSLFSGVQLHQGKIFLDEGYRPKFSNISQSAILHHGPVGHNYSK